MSKKTLYRAGENRIIGGVCAGVAEYFGIDPGIMRLIWVLSIFAAGAGVWAYLVAWAVIPENPEDKRSDLDMAEKGTITKKEKHFVVENFRLYGRSPLLGLILLILGVIFLANNFFPELRLDKYWPLIFIGLGIVLIFSSYNAKNSKR